VVGGRSLRTLLGAPLQGRHWVAALNMLRVYSRPFDAIVRYLLRRGTYPATMQLNTPLGLAAVTLYSHHDLLTVNEIFCRHDYPADADDRVVVDFGSNIGLSAVWFLTRGPETFTYLFEPLPVNVVRLRRNLSPFEGRFAVQQIAVGVQNATVDFGVEPSGRYGGVGARTGQSVSVTCRDANEVLREILEAHRRIDVLKIDIEGTERELVERIPGDIRRRIESIYVEYWFLANPLATTHSYEQYGSVAQFRRRG
jgi:FkbM family methyltransferase